MIDLFASGRPAEDILSRVVRVTLAGVEYELPVLTIGGNKRWKASLDAHLTGMLDGIEGSGDDLSAVFALLNTQVDDMLDLLIEYDTAGILPARDVLEETVYEHELLAAVREVWRAANPFALSGLEAGMAALRESASSPPTSSQPPPTAGRRRKSKVS